MDTTKLLLDLSIEWESLSSLPGYRPFAVKFAEELLVLQQLRETHDEALPEQNAVAAAALEHLSNAFTQWVRDAGRILESGGGLEPKNRLKSYFEKK